MKRNLRRAELFAGIVFSLISLSCASQAHADMKDMKAYKEAFPDSKVKCITCHTVAIPQKGFKDLNAYGEAAMAAASSTAETYRKLGKAEDFKETV